MIFRSIRGLPFLLIIDSVNEITNLSIKSSASFSNPTAAVSETRNENDCVRKLDGSVKDQKGPSTK